MNEILQILCVKLDREVKLKLATRVEDMMRGLAFRKTINDPKYFRAIRKGWTDEKFEALFSVVAFYQEVIGPLCSHSKIHSPTEIGRNIQVVWGNKVRINQDTTSKLKKMQNNFEQLVVELGIKYWWIYTAHPDDLLYQVTKNDEEQTE